MQAAGTDVPVCAAAAKTRPLRYHAAPAVAPQRSGSTAGAMHTESLSSLTKHGHARICRCDRVRVHHTSGSRRQLWVA
ncbi:hypothetical protein EIQ28_01435 [Xanthomonas campestris pv. plantaginis]